MTKTIKIGPEDDQMINQLEANMVQFLMAYSAATGINYWSLMQMLSEPERDSAEWKRWNAVHRMPPGPNRARLCSRSFPKMMQAAAMQWAGHFADAGKMVTK